ncbi:very short patch repair endonuclease [Prosthecobacter sp.]|uniref:very short patch repair endonuclease n=1 Tax=Prosthecobacter sp. TaxID=1965333 RepID=UPI003784DF02
MADIVDSETRSRMMSGIRGKNTRPEIQVRQILHRLGFRFRLHVSRLAGKPDIVLSRFKAAILIHGCFWHGHECALFRWPATRPEFWRQKIGRNRINDARTVEKLREDGWRVATIWECAMRGDTRMNTDELGNTLKKWLHSCVDEIEIPQNLMGRGNESRASF